MGGRSVERRSLPGARAAAWLVLAWALLVGAAVASSPATDAQSPAATPAPAPTPAGVAGPVDPRSSGEGPGLEAEPLIVLAGVVLLGLAAAGGTALYVRLTRED
jgi:hypothetical protein